MTPKGSTLFGCRSLSYRTNKKKPALLGDRLLIFNTVCQTYSATDG